MSFPSNPTVGQQYTLSDRTYIWTGSAWNLYVPASVGATGPQGVTGPEGQTGPEGPTGPVGPVGVADWDGNTEYVGGEFVAYDNKIWRAISANSNTTPDAPENTAWAVQIGIQGPTGSIGPTGPTGPSGPIGFSDWIGDVEYFEGQYIYYNGDIWRAGPTGIEDHPGSENGWGWTQVTTPGPTGPTGPSGESSAWRGEFSSVASYQPGDLVTYTEGMYNTTAIYRALTELIFNGMPHQPPYGSSDWEPFSGPPGATGPVSPYRGDFAAENVTYFTSDVVYHSGELWRAITGPSFGGSPGSAIPAPEEPESGWELITATPADIYEAGPVTGSIVAYPTESGNTINGEYAVISGGQGNFTAANTWELGEAAGSNHSVIGGGYNNKIYSPACSIIGGVNNQIGVEGEGSYDSYNTHIIGSNISVSGSTTLNSTYVNNLKVMGVWDPTLNDNAGGFAGGGITFPDGSVQTVAASGGGYHVAGSAGTATIKPTAGDNDATADYAAVLSGKEAKAAHYGVQAHASGQFSNPGDAQTISAVLRAVTENDQTQNMYLDGTGTGLLIPAFTGWNFSIKLVAIMAFDGTFVGQAAWNIRGAAYRPQSSITPDPTALVADPIIENWATDGAPGLLTVNVSIDGDTLNIAVTGTPSGDAYPYETRWVASVEITQVSFGTP